MSAVHEDILTLVISCYMNCSQYVTYVRKADLYNIVQDFFCWIQQLLVIKVEDL